MKNELSIEVKTYAEQTQSKLQELIKDVKNLSNSVGDSSNKINDYSKKISTGFKLTGIYVAARKVLKTLFGFVDTTNNYSESLNLFNVVMGNTGDAFSEVGKQATVFQNKMAENFGTQRAQTLTYQALYQSMAENMGIASDKAGIMSENTTKLINDLSSLYNKSESTTAEALRAGVFAGQTKPLRAFGLDVTEKSLTPVLDSIGITDRTVRELSQAEKQILRYIAVLRQSSIAHGDWANTIESPSNQLRIFKNQLVETSTALGGLFQGAFAKILPYANAILMVVKEVANALADMFGIEIEDYNSGIASTEDYYEDLEDGINGATDATKKLKRETLSFDQIHNIDDKDASGGVGSLSGGIDQRLLDAINGYDNGLDRVKMKATEIRDKIMEWLGFTKEVDTLTGKVSFKLQEGITPIKVIGATIVGIMGFKIGSKLLDIWKGIKNIKTSLLGTETAIDGNTEKLTLLGKTYKSLKTDGIAKTVDKIKNKLVTLAPKVAKVTGVVGGLTLAFVGANGLAKAVKQNKLATDEAEKANGKLVLSLAETVGGATLAGVALGGPFGAAVGFVSGLLVSGVSAVVGYQQALNEIAYNNVFGTLSVSAEGWANALNLSSESTLNATGRYEELTTKMSSLGSAFSENADKLDWYGICFGQLSQKISEEDSVNITNAISQMFENANEIIDTNTNYQIDVLTTAFSTMTTLSEDEQKNILNSIINYGESQKNELAIAQDNITKTYDNAIKARGYLTDEEYKYIQEQLAKIRKLTQREMTANQADIQYYKTYFKDQNNKLDEQSYKEFESALTTYHDNRLAEIKEQYRQELQVAENMKQDKLITEETYNQMLQDAYDRRMASEKGIDDEIKKYRLDVYSSILTEYSKLVNATDECLVDAQSQTIKTMENLFKNLNINTNDLLSSLGLAGKQAGKKFANSYLQEQQKIFDSAKMTIKDPEGNNQVYRPYGFTFNAYDTGGFPEDGWFRASRGEIMGKFDNGQSVVANNLQIIEGIKQGVAEGMIQASQYTGGSNKVDVEVHADKGFFVDTVVESVKETIRRTGYNPFEEGV